MSIFSQRLRALRNARGISQQELGRQLGLSKSSVNMYERGEREPGLETLRVMAEYFDVDMNYLLGHAETLPDNVVPLPPMGRIPLVGTIACGTPILAVENVEDMVFVPETIHADFALRCQGDSMVGAEIYDGDLVYIRQQDSVYNGQIAAVLIGEEATLKRFYYDEEAGLVTLSAENPAYPPKIFRGEELNQIHILGLAVGLTRKLH